ncbi:uncharacterized protein CIMG_13641 [Coccidioides immitis RS]|uniref:Uncharacterized protein n=1 Tax=Coccidioides immitis (strain RS) TaxID=246410 RepID=I9NPV4_COCIM|nr:uncharacterized protein CIMG_13637 [Coccidioides immitis RS]XP_004444941.1 uncharacterized protein CIMG_13639 [Coccidioides immitis RS]XP_004444943.1 uncharacterized protein CIMG_13641 [Coccidioides immitis RS]KJF61411.1 hypothetical protein CIMG_13637 [Coccidioides immitis RS]KJF61413.1 hypothetical protein CIMG_13639 [Coccidioides immitis RS]KJF61415.1 hypothetical protein CIMG_13641 [Coccidioides immitis RS]
MLRCGDAEMTDHTLSGYRHNMSGFAQLVRPAGRRAQTPIFKEHHYRGVRVMSGGHRALVRGSSRICPRGHARHVRGLPPGVIAHWSGGYRALVRGLSRICSRGHARHVRGLPPGVIAHWSGGYRASALGGTRATSGGYRALARGSSRIYSRGHARLVRGSPRTGPGARATSGGHRALVRRVGARYSSSDDVV